MYISPAAVRQLASTVVGIGPANDRAFFAHFGCSSDVISIVWQKIHRIKPRSCKPKHVLWALLFLKTYNSEDVLASRVGTNRKTFRKWVWTVLKLIQGLKRSTVRACFLVLISKSLFCFSNSHECICRLCGRIERNTVAETINGVW